MTNPFGSAAAEKMISRMFRRVDTVVWDLMTGRLGVRTSDGEIATFEGTDADSATVNLNPFDDFGVALPAFAQSTPATSVQVGDLVYKSGTRPAWITEVVEKPDGSKRFKTIDPSGSLGSWNPPKVSVFGLDSGVLVVRSLLSMFPGDGTAGLTGLQGTLMPLLMFGGGDSGLDLEKLLPLILMGSINGSGAMGGGNVIQTLFMMKMLGGDNNLFGGSSRKPTFRG